jgi:hypothetical protein
MGLMRLVYASRPFGFDEATIFGILLTARRRNAETGVTGALVCRADLYLQLLEGPEEAVEPLYARIRRDDRHIEVARLGSAPSAVRLFPDWAMRHDPARSWMWSRAEVEAGVIARVAPEEAFAVFDRLAREPADA